MKLYSIAVILLMVPMAFAELPNTVAARLIYDHGRVIAETKEGKLRWAKSVKDLNLSFDPYEKLWLQNVMKDKKNYAKMSFTAEVMRLPNGSRYDNYDCVQESEESLRRFLLDYKGEATCEGATRLRNSTQEEIDQMNKFKSNPDGRFGFKAIHDKGNLTISSSSYTNFEMHRSANRLFVEAEIMSYNTGWPSSNYRRIWLFRYQNLSFVVENTDYGVDCMKTDVENLLVVKCDHNIRARSLRKNEDLL